MRHGSGFSIPSVAVALAALLLTAPLTQAQTCTQLPLNAEAWWAGDGDESDLLGVHSPSGTIGSPTFVAAVVGSGLEFGGSDGLVVADDAGLETYGIGRITFAAWLRVDAVPVTGNGIVLDKRVPGASFDAGYSLRVVPGGGPDLVEFEFTAADGAFEARVSTGPLATGVFHHVTVVYDGYPAGYVRAYAGGILRNVSNVERVTDLRTSSDLSIGYPSPGISGAEPFQGVIDELQIYRRALTHCEIGRLVTAGSGGACKGDSDGDTIVDYLDNCPFVANTGQVNSDWDRAGDVCDCDPLEGGLTAAPGALSGMLVGLDDDRDKLAWCGLDGGMGSATTFNLVRGDLAELPVGAGESDSCVASATPYDEWTDNNAPPPGQGWWYLARAVSDCGVGIYGLGPGGIPRSSATIDSCPTTEEELCDATVGFWDINTCGHWTCGAPPDCDGIIPGCNCFLGRSFFLGTGCDFDITCP